VTTRARDTLRSSDVLLAIVLVLLLLVVMPQPKPAPVAMGGGVGGSGQGLQRAMAAGCSTEDVGWNANPVHDGSGRGPCVTALSDSVGPPLGGPAVALSTAWSPSHALDWAAAQAPPNGGMEGAGLASDSPNGTAVLFGGQSLGVLDSSTQVYNETTNSWTFLHPSSSPAPRSYFAFGADPSTRVAVLFGGIVNASSLQVDNSTWVYQFENETWVNVSASVAPEPREDSAFAIDPTAGYGLLYGGWNQDYSPTSSITYSDLWRFTLSTDSWSRVLPAPASPLPPPLHGARFTWDPVANEFDLFGGCYPCSNVVWQFSPVTGVWSEVSAPSGTLPGARADSSWNWDPVNQADVLFGGTSSAVSFGDTFEFLPTGDHWTEIEPTVAPSARFASASAWLNVTGNETLLLSGGNTSLPVPDLWRLAPTSNLSIRVVDFDNDSPISGANVSVDGLPPLPTNQIGYLNLTQLNATETFLNVTKLGLVRDHLFPPLSRLLPVRGGEHLPGSPCDASRNGALLERPSHCERHGDGDRRRGLRGWVPRHHGSRR